MLFQQLQTAQPQRASWHYRHCAAIPRFSVLVSLRCFAAQRDSADLLVVQPRHQNRQDLDEALRLAETYTGSQCPHLLVGRSSNFRPTPSTFFGPGTLESIEAYRQMHDCRKVFVNAALSGVQLRNLERTVGSQVFDRIGLIIGIFAQRAQTKEAKLQVELAKLEYEASRLVRVRDTAGQRGAFGEGLEVVSARDRGRSGSSGLGGGGPGESELALQRTRILKKKKILKKRIAEVRRTRKLQRRGRQRRNMPVVAVVGYTNAGKTTLVSKLTKKDLQSDDMLFATLDPAVKRLVLPSKKFVALADTVGFISDLPVQLVDAFRATLEEVIEADILLHVLDASAPNVHEQREAVIQILTELGLDGEYLNDRVIEVWNKADCIEETTESSLPAFDAHATERRSSDALPFPVARTQSHKRPARRPTRVLVSAVSGYGLDQLAQIIETKVAFLLGPRPWAPSWVDYDENYNEDYEPSAQLG